MAAHLLGLALGQGGGNHGLAFSEEIRMFINTVTSKPAYLCNNFNELLILNSACVWFIPFVLIYVYDHRPFPPPPKCQISLVLLYKSCNQFSHLFVHRLPSVRNSSQLCTDIGVEHVSPKLSWPLLCCQSASFGVDFFLKLTLSFKVKRLFWISIWFITLTLFTSFLPQLTFLLS